MNKEDLIQGEYYCAYNANIFIWGNIDSNYYLGDQCTTFSKGRGYFNSAKRLATPEEKHWLDECIRLNKFITKEEAMKTFEPEFVLPNKYCVVHHKKVADYILKLENKTEGFSEDLNLISHFPKITNKYCFKFKQEDYTEITFEQFKKYVLKEPTREVTIKLDSRVYSLDEISKALTKEYDKVDVEDILKVIYEPSTKEAYDEQNKPKLDYEILSFKLKVGLVVPLYKQQNELYKRTDITEPTSFQGYTLEYLLNPVNNFNIHSIKRLSDGEVFTIGDKIKYTDGSFERDPCPINDLTLHYNKIFVNRHYQGQPNRLISEWVKFNPDSKPVKSKDDLITVQLTKEKYDLLMQLLQE